MEQAAAQRRPVTTAASLFLTGMMLSAMWKRSPHETAVLGMVLLFAALSMTNCYWIVLALVPLAGELWLPTAAVLGLSALVFGMNLIAPDQFGATYSVASWALLIFFVVWLVPSSMKSLRILLDRNRQRASS